MNEIQLMKLIVFYIKNISWNTQSQFLCFKRSNSESTNTKVFFNYTLSLVTYINIDICYSIFLIILFSIDTYLPCQAAWSHLAVPP